MKAVLLSAIWMYKTTTTWLHNITDAKLCNHVVVAQFGIRNIPTVLFFKDGKVVDKQVGAAPKTTFVSKIEALL